MTTDDLDARQFDFLVGEWRATCRSADADGCWTEGVGSLTATKILDGCVSLELFEGPYLGRVIKGIGLRAYNRTTSEWEHTWTDSSAPGGFLVWRGRFKGESINLYGRWEQFDGQHVMSRLTWFDIKEQSARWVSHRSFDNGETWVKHWEIHLSKGHTAETDPHEN
jgi:hypothetical protein